jgi:hypothetical protein
MESGWLRTRRPGFSSWPEQDIFLYFTLSILPLSLIQPSIQWVRMHFPCVKWPVRKVNHSLQSIADVNNGCEVVAGVSILVPPGPNMSLWRGA